MQPPIISTWFVSIQQSLWFDILFNVIHWRNVFFRLFVSQGVEIDYVHTTRSSNNVSPVYPGFHYIGVVVTRIVVVLQQAFRNLGANVKAASFLASDKR